MDLPVFIAILTPVIAVQVMLLAIGLGDLTRPGRQVRLANKPVWAIVIVLVGFIGPALYFMLGREPE
ncbi:MAG TPA: PLDc N-terminal domain-containing protein [Candidatus Limnocylindrales bacterium]|nr:PLDc N-terminal domain-containing protein [Candidatus Limnocylindrales bacterium]